MNWYHQYKLATDLIEPTKQSKDFDDFFDDTGTRPKLIRIDPPTQKTVTINLYRGFDLEWATKASSSSWFIEPSRSEQGFLWFTHDLMGAWRAKEYVSGRGDTLLTYPLQVIKHVQTKHFDDGSKYDEIPEEIMDQANRIENCKYYLGYELPSGFLFSYKTEKFIICDHMLEVPRSMLKINEERDVEDPE